MQANRLFRLGMTLAEGSVRRRRASRAIQLAAISISIAALRLLRVLNNNLRPTVAVVLVPAGPLGVAVMPAKCLLKLGTATRWAGLACPRLAHAILIN